MYVELYIFFGRFNRNKKEIERERVRINDENIVIM
jgi:hypothetical protein